MHTQAHSNKKDIFYDPSKIFKRIQIDHKTLIKLKSLNNYKKIDLNHICENLYNRILSVKDLKEDKIINIITGINDKPELLIISFFTYNLTILFLEDALREVPFAPEILSQISVYTAIFKDIILITIEKILDFIPNLA